MERKMIYLDDAIRIAEQGQIQGFPWQFEQLVKLPTIQPVFSELCSAELTCEGCKWEKNGQDLCYECCRGCGDMYEEREENG